LLILLAKYRATGIVIFYGLGPGKALTTLILRKLGRNRKSCLLEKERTMDAGGKETCTLNTILCLGVRENRSREGDASHSRSARSPWEPIKAAGA